MITMYIIISVAVLLCILLYKLIVKHAKTKLLRTPEIKSVLNKFDIQPDYFLQINQQVLLLDSRKKLFILHQNEKQDLFFNLNQLKSCELKQRSNSDQVVEFSDLEIKTETQNTTISFYDVKRDDPFDKRWLLLKAEEWHLLLKKNK